MRSLYGKFLVFTIITMFGSAIVAFLIVNTYYHQFLKPDNDAKNMRILHNITDFIEANPDLDLQQFLMTQADVGYKIVLVTKEQKSLDMRTFGEPFRSYNLDNQVMLDVLNGADYHGIRDLPNETFVTGFFADELANSVGTPFTFNDKTYALFLRPNIKMLFTEVHYLLGGMFIGMGVISLIAMLFGARRLIKPLRQLTSATKNIGAGQFDVPLPNKSNDEIGQLSRSFNQMTNELAKADSIQKQFITDISHDLQTPLQQMKGYAALLREGNLSESEKNKYLHIIERETDRLSNLSRQLLILTSLDAELEYVSFSLFRLDEQIKHVLLRFRWQLEKKHITVTSELDEVTIKAVESYTEQIWENLLSNAIKYTSKGKTISLALQSHDDNVEFTIKDTGIGMSEEDMPYIFDRFYRIDDARNSHIEGTGLGLPIVKRIVDFHGGTILVNSSVDQGTSITVNLNKTNV